MINKYLTFAKNAGFAALGGAAAGWGGAELSDLITNSEKINSITSAVSQYIGAGCTFLYFHSKDYPETSQDIKDSKKKILNFVKDFTKLNVGVAALDVYYFIAKPYLTYRFQKEGYDPGSASLMADCIVIPSYAIFSIPIIKGMGFIKDKKEIY